MAREGGGRRWQGREVGGVAREGGGRGGKGGRWEGWQGREVGGVAREDWRKRSNTRKSQGMGERRKRRVEEG